MEDWNGISLGVMNDLNATTNATIADGGLRCDAILGGLHPYFQHLHGFVCLVICIFGAMANLLNIIVLTRKEMNTSPINRIFTGQSIDPKVHSGQATLFFCVHDQTMLFAQP